MVALARILSISTVAAAFLLHAATASVTAGPGTHLFPRINSNCRTDCPATVPTCDCADDEQCSLTSQTCDTCAAVKCIKNDQSQNGGGSSSAPVGAIVGGLIGGLAVVAVAGYFLWRKYGRKRQNRASMAATAAEKENDFGMVKSARASTHTIASIASTVRTRASNVIQIAYIPGVTNRSTPSSPSHLIPPVPPLPMSNSPVGSQFPRSPNGDIQFAADDLLRGSMITVDNRSSVATTIYGAVVSQPNIVRAGKAAVVQVKGGSSVATSSSNSPSAESVPPMPSLFTSGGASRKKSNQDAVPPSPAFSVGSTFLNKTQSAGSDGSEARGVRRSEVIPENHPISSFEDSDDDEEDITPGHRSKKVQSQCSSCITDMDTGSPFSDANSLSIDDLPVPPNSGLPPGGIGRRISLTPTAAKRASKKRESLVGSQERTVSPFDDSHSIDKVDP